MRDGCIYKYWDFLNCKSPGFALELGVRERGLAVVSGENLEVPWCGDERQQSQRNPGTEQSQQPQELIPSWAHIGGTLPAPPEQTRVL